jgi:SAM-dependent methyltransferase
MVMLSVAARERVRSSVPWWAKCGLKLALAPLPVGYRALRALSLAGHGGMQRPDFAYEVFRRHFDAADVPRKPSGFTVLEMGPGDALSTAVIAKAHGAASTCMVDVGPFATTDVDLYRKMAQFLAARGMAAPDLSSARSLADVLASCCARYETGGLASLRALPEASIDFIFSNAVLQCLAPRDLRETMDAMRRVLHPQGVCVHSIDLRDMMGQSLNHLRFSDRVWESAWFRRSRFYTNRLRFHEWMALFRSAGFDVELSEVNRWTRLPVARESLARRYQHMAGEELLVANMRVVLRHAPAARRPDRTRAPALCADRAAAESGAAA